MRGQFQLHVGLRSVKGTYSPTFGVFRGHLDADLLVALAPSVCLLSMQLAIPCGGQPRSIALFHCAQLKTLLWVIRFGRVAAKCHYHLWVAETATRLT